jgi:hypothetical protein
MNGGRSGASISKPVVPEVQKVQDKMIKEIEYLKKGPLRYYVVPRKPLM